MSMPKQDDFLEMIIAGKDSKGGSAVRRGKVVGFFSNGEPKIQFAGEESPREKIFTRLSESVSLGDRVFLLEAFGSWLYWKDYTTDYKGV